MWTIISIFVDLVLHWHYIWLYSCWDDTDNVGIWWIIKGPITASLLVSIGVKHQVPDKLACLVFCFVVADLQLKFYNEILH